MRNSGRKFRRRLSWGSKRAKKPKSLPIGKTGSLINAYLCKPETPNQEHGKKVIARLAADLGIGESCRGRITGL